MHRTQSWDVATTATAGDSVPVMEMGVGVLRPRRRGMGIGFAVLLGRIVLICRRRVVLVNARTVGVAARRCWALTAVNSGGG